MRLVIIGSYSQVQDGGIENGMSGPREFRVEDL